MPSISIAVGQVGCRLGDAPHNLELFVEAVERAARAGADLLVLPECALTRYVFRSAEEAASAAIPSSGKEARAFGAAVGRAGIHAAVGFLEGSGRSLYNTVMLVGPDGPVGRYRKAHIPPLGADRFVRRDAAPVPVFETPIGRVGMEICYELRFPESVRSLALAGAEVIAQQANFGVGGPEDRHRPLRARPRVRELGLPRGRQPPGPRGQLSLLREERGRCPEWRRPRPRMREVGPDRG